MLGAAEGGGAGSSAADGPRRARSAVPEVHDVHGGLVPPVEHQHHQDVPHLVAGAQVVQLTWEERPRPGGVYVYVYMCV